MMTRRKSLSSLAACGALGIASIPLVPENLSIAAVRPPPPPSPWTPLNFLIDATDPSFGTIDTPANTTATFQNALAYCFGSVQNPHGSNGATTNKVLMIPPGYFRITAPLQIQYLHGGRIIGAGRDDTIIENISGGDVIHTNGCGYSHFEGMLLKTSGGESACFNLDWDGSQGGAALQSNTFSNMHFAGGGYGVLIGDGGFMGSENLFLNCYFVGCTKAGLCTANFNALSQTVIGGNARNNGTGILVDAGSVPAIIGVGFQSQTGFDIDIRNTAYDTYTISGCRTESANFASFGQNIQQAGIRDCSQRASVGGWFLSGSGMFEVSHCYSHMGQIAVGNDAAITISGSLFQRNDWFANFGQGPNAVIEIEKSRFGNPWTQIAKQRITSAGKFNYTVTPVA